MEIVKKTSLIIRGIFWFWSLLFFLITVSEIKQLNAESIGERKFFMLLVTSFLLLIHICLYLIIVIDNSRKKYFSKLEFVLFVAGLIISILFFLALRNNVNIII